MWSVSDVEGFTRSVLSVMRMIAERFPLVMIPPMDGQVWKNLIALFSSREPNDWMTAEVASYGSYVRAFLMPQGSPLVSLLDLDCFSNYLRGVQSTSHVSTGLTLSEEEEDTEPDMQDEGGEVPECPTARLGHGSPGAAWGGPVG